jgi:Zn-dependent M28 family amino/carboxypeptidase
VLARIGIRGRCASVAEIFPDAAMPTVERLRAGLPMGAPLLLAVLLCSCQRAPVPAATAVPDPVAARIRADVRVLSDDAMQGRETGTPGFDRAADAVAARMRAIGLQPAGDHSGYAQIVPLLRATSVIDGARLDVVRADRTIHLRVADQFLPAPDFAAPSRALRAPAVFVGQGIDAPDLGLDDFAGLDVRGRIAVVLGGAPPVADNDRRAVLGSEPEKLRTLARHGAVGVIFVDTAEDEMQMPWALRIARAARPALRLRDADGHAIDALPQLQVVARVSAAAADLLLDGSGHTAAELADAARAGRLRGFALPATLDLATRTRVAPLDSHNVIGRLPGRDPGLAAQAVLFTAHLDHLGVLAPSAPAPGGDRIYNGALDNALGVAIVLETARRLHAQPQAPRRSILFAALTGEEQGLLGAQWLALHPPARLVADINLDMPMLLAPTRDVVPIGSGHSSLRDSVARAAADVGLALSADPFPEEAVFVRSDQYAFVRAGIPSLVLDGGVIPAASSAGKPADLHTMPKLAQRDFLRRCYHQPCDDVRLPIQYGDAARLARLGARLATRLGDAAQPPRWNPGDTFAAPAAASK